MERKLLPVSESNFENLRKMDQYYVDKTHLIHSLLCPNPWPPKFLSRPRRFGKSLLLDTIRCLYEGRKELFEGLYIHNKWDWDPENTHPVIKLDFSNSEPSTNDEFRTGVSFQINRSKFASHALIGPPDVILGELIHLAYEKTNQKVVVLIDEYDAPLIAMTRASRKDYEDTHTNMRGILKCLKSQRGEIEFIFMTGILKLSQHDFFSAANIFDDISMCSDYNEICGYTEEELLQTFQPELEREDLNPNIHIDSLREWYDGYRWGAPTRLYNPNDILKTFQNNRLYSWWATYGLTTIAIDKIKEKHDFSFENYKSSINDDFLEEGLSLTSTNVNLDAILFQTGYLTIRTPTTKEPTTLTLQLEPPNLEVKVALARLRLSLLTKDKVGKKEFSTLLEKLAQCDFGEVQSKICQILAEIVYDEKPEELRERDFSILVRSMFLACGLPDAQTEKHTQCGRADLVLHYQPTNTYYVMEFKVLGIGGNQPGCAMSQIKTQDYAAPYKDKGRVFILGFEFSVSSAMPKATLTNLDWEPYKP